MQTKKIIIHSSTETWSTQIRKWFLAYIFQTYIGQVKHSNHLSLFTAIYRTSGSLVHLLKSSLGTGVLAMPMAFRNSGTLVGAVGTLVIGFICTYCVHILVCIRGVDDENCRRYGVISLASLLQVKTSNDVCKKAKIPALGFAETAGKVFECGPPMARRWSNFAQ